MGKIIAFVHIEKAAGTTITEILRNNFGSDHADVFALNKSDSFTQKDLNKVKLLYPKLKSIAGHKIKPYVDFKDEILFYTIFRDPIARAISHYQYLIETSLVEVPDFKTWISMQENQNFQTKKIAGEASLEKAIEILKAKFVFVGTLENLDESFQNLFNVLPYKIDFSEFKTQNSSKNNSIKQQILQDEQLVELLIKHNNIDIKLFNLIKDGNEFKFENAHNKIILTSSKNQFNRFYGTFIRYFLFKPFLRINNLLNSGSLKIEFQMVGLESSFLGHFFPTLQIKFFRILFSKRKNNGIYRKNQI